MENMDWLSRIAPWLKDRLAGAGGSAAPEGHLFGGGGWPFFGNAGQTPSTPVSTGMPPTAREGLGFPGGGQLFGGGAGTFGGGDLASKLASLGGFGAPGMGPAQGVANSFSSPAVEAVGAGRGGFSAPQGGMMRGFAEGGRPEPGEDIVVGEKGPEVVVSDSDRTKGIAALKRKMGGDTPWYMERGAALDSRYGRANIGSAMLDAYTVDKHVPRRGFEEGGRPGVGEDVVVGENGPEVVRLDQPGTVIPNHAIPPWLQDAMVQMPAPAPQPQQRGPLRSMAAGRQVTDWRDRDPDAAMQETKDRWANIRDNPAETFENLGITGQVLAAALRSASPNAAQAQSAGGKKVQKPQQTTPMDKVMEEQQFLTDKGFYKGEIDGADGPKTQQARKEYQVAQEKLKEQQLKERELAIQEGQLAVGEKKSEADIKGAENTRIELENKEKERLALQKRREEGEAKLRESEKNLSPWDKALRSYGPVVGGLLGTVAGPVARSTVKKVGDKWFASSAKEAEAALGTPTSAVTKENLAERVGNINDWYRRGGAKNEPFVSVPGKTPGVEVNSATATPIKDLYQRGFLSTKGADIGGMAPFAIDSAISGAYLPDAQVAFDKAKEAVAADPSDVNIESYQAAKSKVAALETAMRFGLAGAATYPVAALAKQRHPIQPPTNVADAEKLRIEGFLREQGTAAEKAAKAAATRQANAAKKAANPTPSLQEMTPGASGPLPANPMRKFDNQGNPINRGESTPSLQELTAPEPIRAHVPRRTRKKAENG